MDIEIYPLDKVVTDGIPVFLGMEQAAVEAAIGKGQLVGRRYYYYHSDMAIDYSEDGRVAFIEFLGGIDGSLQPVIYGVSAFETPADELAELLRRKNGGETEDLEQGYCLVFANISVGVWRERKPSDVEELMEEMRADGISTDGNAEIEAEKRKADYWATIGIGVAGYYRR